MDYSTIIQIAPWLVGLGGSLFSMFIAYRLLQERYATEQKFSAMESELDNKLSTQEKQISSLRSAIDLLMATIDKKTIDQLLAQERSICSKIDNHVAALSIKIDQNSLHADNKFMTSDLLREKFARIEDSISVVTRRAEATSQRLHDLVEGPHRRLFEQGMRQPPEQR